MKMKTKKNKRANQVSENIKSTIVTGVALMVTFVMVTLMITQLASATTNSMAMYPKSFIPFWSQERRGYETTLLNTNQIVRIEPIFDPSEDEPTHKDIIYLKVHLVDGNHITVQEDFEDFYSRIRVSQAK
jgi:hypothetical protein